MNTLPRATQKNNVFNRTERFRLKHPASVILAAANLFEVFGTHSFI